MQVIMPREKSESERAAGRLILAIQKEWGLELGEPEAEQSELVMGRAHELLQARNAVSMPGLTHQCLYFEQPHTFEQILFIQTAEPALVGHA